MNSRTRKAPQAQYPATEEVLRHISEWRSINSEDALLPSVAKPPPSLITSGFGAFNPARNGARGTFRDGSRVSGSSTREVLLARPPTEHLDHCDAGNSVNDIRNQCTVYANTRSDGPGYTMVRFFRQWHTCTRQDANYLFTG